jgi:hypothetical protein
MNREDLSTAGTGEALMHNKQYSMPRNRDATSLDCYYAITLKCNLLDTVTTQEAIQDMINKKFKKFVVHTQVWELDKRNKLHCHILASGSKTTKYKNFREYGWNLHLEQLLTPGSKNRWESYLDKDQESDVLLRFESLRYNLFD